jgi:hypothetical protein
MCSKASYFSVFSVPSVVSVCFPDLLTLRRGVIHRIMPKSLQPVVRNSGPFSVINTSSSR